MLSTIVGLPLLFLLTCRAGPTMVMSITGRLDRILDAPGMVQQTAAGKMTIGGIT